MTQMAKNLMQCKRPGFDPRVSKIPWRTEWQPIPAFLPEEFHGQGSVAGYSPWSRKESETTEQLTLFTFLFVYNNCYVIFGNTGSLGDCSPAISLKN